MNGGSGGTLSGAAGSTAAVARGLELIREGAALVAGAGLWSLSDADLREAVRAGHAATGAVESAWLGLVAGLDARSDAVPGARPGRVAATFLVHGLRVAAGKAASDVAAAHALDPEGGVLPGLASAFAAGEVSRAHVDVAVRVLRRVPIRLLADVDAAGTSNAERLDAFLTEQARVLAPPVTDRLAARVLDHLDPERLDRFDALAYQRRELTAVVDSTGMLVLRGQCDPAGGAVVRAALDHYVAPPAQPTGQTEDGQTVLVPDDRSRAQRYADALVAICRQALLRTDPARPHPAQVLIVTTPQQVAAARAHPPSSGSAGASAGLAECVQTGPIGGGLVGRWVCDGLVQRVLLAPTGAALDLGRAVRLATPAQRKALAARDGGCVIPGCGVPPAGCEAHHVWAWADGGTTDLDNQALVCARHHDAVHAGIWRLVMIGGVPRVIPPAWVDPARRPLRNPVHDGRRQADALGRQLRLAINGPVAHDPQPRGDPPDDD